MDLVRALLLALEEHEHSYVPGSVEIEGYTEEKIGYHCHLVKQAGLADGYDDATMDNTSPSSGLTSLTWQGHEFIDAARHPDIWSQSKAMMAKAGGGYFQVWPAVLSELVKKNVGL